MNKRNKIILFLVVVIIVLSYIILNYQNYDLKLGVFAGSNWNVPSGDSYKEVENIINKFQDEHHTSVSYLPGIPKEDYQEWLSQRLIEDDMPDVFLIPSTMYEKYAKSGALKKLDGLIASDKDITIEEYYPSTIDPCDIDGSYYALPYKSVPNVMLVNEDLLKELGLTKPVDDWCWQDFYEICQSVKAYNENSDQKIYAYVGYDWTMAVYSNDISLYDEETGEVFANDEKFIAAIEYMRMLNNLQVKSDTIEDFDNGKALFCVMNYSDYRTYSPYPWRIKKFSDFKWDYISFPRGVAGNNVSEVDTLMVAISSRTKNPNLSWELLKYMTNSEELQKNIVKNSEAVSPLISVMQNEEIIKYLKQDNIEDTYDTKTIDDIMQNSISVKHTEEYDEIKELADIKIEELINNSDYDIESAMIKLRNSIIELIKS